MRIKSFADFTSTVTFIACAISAYALLAAVVWIGCER